MDLHAPPNEISVSVSVSESSDDRLRRLLESKRDIAAFLHRHEGLLTTLKQQSDNNHPVSREDILFMARRISLTTRAIPYKGAVLRDLYPINHLPYPAIDELSNDSALRRLQRAYGDQKVASEDINNNNSKSNNNSNSNSDKVPLILDKSSKALLLKRFGIVSAVPAASLPGSRLTSSSSSSNAYDSSPAPPPTPPPVDKSPSSNQMTSEFYLSDSDED